MCAGIVAAPRKVGPNKLEKTVVRKVYVAVVAGGRAVLRYARCAWERYRESSLPQFEVYIGRLKC